MRFALCSERLQGNYLLAVFRHRRLALKIDASARGRTSDQIMSTLSSLAALGAFGGQQNDPATFLRLLGIAATFTCTSLMAVELRNHCRSISFSPKSRSAIMPFFRQYSSKRLDSTIGRDSSVYFRLMMWFNHGSWPIA